MKARGWRRRYEWYAAAIFLLALLVPAVFFQALPVATAVAAIQLIFPNQLRGQMSALFLFCLNLGGLTLGPLMPAVFNDYVFKNEKMIGPSLALTIGIAATLTLIVFLATFRPYRRHYRLMHYDLKDEARTYRSLDTRANLRR